MREKHEAENVTNYTSNMLSSLAFGAIGNYLSSEVGGRIYSYVTGKDESLLLGVVGGLVGIGIGLVYGPRIIRGLYRMVSRRVR
ncbi:MAG: hypothetical protein HY361_04635 [Candidatus Aenigmarchaeota archaeon]|nr:hypothetical protein [Candidatus Aenigmarchaeota archaeon]